MFEERYKAFHALLTKTKHETVLGQLEEVERHAPELYAAFHLVSLALIAEVLGAEEEPGEIARRAGDLVLNMPEAVLNAAMYLDWDFVDRKWLCDKLQRWAHAAWAAGHRDEPGYAC